MRSDNKYLALTFTFFALAILIGLRFLPSYTKLALVFLVLPSIFFLLRKEERLAEKRLLVVLGLSLLVGFIWDTVAIRLDIWNFTPRSVSWWLIGIPLEEYVFFICFPIIVLGLYTSLPAFRSSIFDRPRFNEIPLLALVFIGQFALWLFLLFSSAESYIKWLLFFVGLPSMYNIWRKGGKIDEVRLLISLATIIVVGFGVDYLFVKAGAWYYRDAALLGKIGIVPIDDMLFGVFVAINIIGLYTSLPRKNILTGRW